MKKFYTLFTALFFALFSFMTYAQGPWNFNGSNDIWESTGTIANLTSGASFSTLDVNSAGNPMLRTFSANINASAVTHAVITLKNNTANKYMRVFYQTTGTNRYVNVGITANDADFVSYYVDMTGNADWTGTVNELTIQFKENSSYSTALDGTIDIDNIEMTSSDLGVNMVNNSSFENWVDDTEATPVDPVGFYKHESVERSSDSHSGDYSLKVIATSTRDLAQTVNEITAGATYRVSINYKIEANTGNGVRLWSTWKDASNVSLASSDLQPSGFLNTVSSEWATFSVDAVAPENATKLNFEVRSYGGATVYWDSFSVSKVAEPVQPLLITTSVCSTATSVRLTGPWWGWDPAGGPEAANNGDGTWTFTFDPAPTDNMEYLLVVNGVQENLISIMANGGDCAPVTDNANYANRRWDLGTGDVTNTYGQCGSTCVAPVITLTGTDVTINNGDTYTDAGATASDDEEGDITANIVLGGDTVDTNTDGTYTITYDVSDGAGNAATTVSRVVTVETPVQPLLITTSVCSTATSVRLTGPWWGWDPAGGPEAANNGDGTWTFTFDPAPTDNMEYLLVVNGVQENLISIMANGGDCAPVTDNANYANRRWDLGTGDVTNTYGQCGSTCVAPVITLTGTDVTINNGDTYTDAGATASDDEEGDITANIVLGGDTVDTNTDGTYTITYDVSDGAGNAATTVSRVVTVETPVQPLLITTSACSTATSVRLTGPWWGWDPAGGPEAANNGDGTWTFTFDPAPTDNMEYLLVVDGVQENLISIMANGGTCAPVTDNASYANRLWVVDSGDVTNNYGQCGTTCVAPVITLTGGDETITVGDTYTDAGATASDDEQGDISSDILTTSDVDTSVAGVYTVAYNVSDGALNAATEVTRTVTVEAALPPNESDSEQFCANGTDAAPTSITLTPDDLTVNNGANLLSVSVTSGTIGNPAYVGNWYDANLTVTGGVSDGITATGLAQMSDLDITGFTSITMTSVDLDAYADTVEMCLNLLVTWELPTVNDDEVVCANGTDAAPTTITLTPNDLTVNGGQQITAISVTSGTIGNPAYVGNWYDANLTVTGGVSDGITATGLAQMSDLDITGFTSITMTSVDLDAYADTVEMCLNLSVTYLEPSCLDPTDLAVSDVTTTTASVTWTANNGETAWEYQVVESGATPAETGTATSDNPLALTGLTANTAYDVYVRANCGDGVTSAWVMVSFTTPLTTQTSFPYCSSFDTDLGDWSTEVTQGTSNWESASSSNNSVAAYSGGGSAYYYSGNYNGDSSVLISRPMDITALASPQVTFQIANPSWGADQDVLEVWYKATAADAWSVLGTYSDATTTFSEVTLNLPNASNDYYIAFNATSGYGYGVLIDDVCIAEAPSCIDPTDLTVADITQTTASVTWTANNGESAWEYQVVESGVAPDATGTATSDNPLALTGLTENTLYDVYVRANCDADGTSEWVTVSFTTLPAPIVPDYTNDFTTFPGDLWSEAVGAIADGPSGTTSLWIPVILHMELMLQLHILIFTLLIR